MNLSTRRRLLKTGLASALLAASGMPATALPRRGGCLRIALDVGAAPAFGLPAGWDPEFAHMAVYAGIFDTLVEIGPDGSLRGELAERWQGSPDARDWSFRLREGVRFHDGTPVEAEHVARSPGFLGQSATPGFIAGVEVTGRHELRLRLARPDTGFPFLLSDPGFAVVHRSGGTTPVGSGPYQMTRFLPGDRLEAERSEQAHNAGSGHFDRVEVLTSSLLDRRLGMLRAGRVDALAESAPDLLLRPPAASGLRVERIAAARYLVLDMSRVVGAQLRDGIGRAVHAEAMVEKVLHGFGRPVHSTPSPTPVDAVDPAEIGIATGIGFDETAARLVTHLARAARREGLILCPGTGRHGDLGVRWAGAGEAQAILAAGDRDQVVALAADTLGLVSDRLRGPEHSGRKFPLDDARLVRRWSLA